MGVRRRLSAIGAAVLAGALVVASASPAAAAETTIQANGEVTSPEWSESAGITAGPEVGRTGAGYEITAAAGPGYAQWSNELLVPDAAYWSMRAWVQVKEVGDDESVDLVTIRNSNGVDNFDFFLGASRERFRWDIVGEQPGRSIDEAAVDKWHLIEAYGDFEGTTHEATVRIDGEDQGTLTSTGQKPATVLSLWLGTSNPKTHRQWYDDVAMRVSDAPLEYLGTLPTPKSATAAPTSVRPSSAAPRAPSATPTTAVLGAGQSEATAGGGSSRGPLVWVAICLVALAGLGVAWWRSRRRDDDDVLV